MGEGDLREGEKGPGDPSAEEKEERVYEGAAEGRASRVCEDRGDVDFWCDVDNKMFGILKEGGIL